MEVKDYGIDELMISCLARTVKDGEMVFFGLASILPSIACLLAKQTHAPHAVIITGTPAGIDSKPPYIPRTGNEPQLLEECITVLRIYEVFDLAQQGRLDRVFLSGIQIDKYGNTNVTALGDPFKPTLKGPGGAGGANLSCDAKHITLWTASQRARPPIYKLVDRVSFITDVGYLDGPGCRERLGLRGGGPEWLITELAVFSFDKNTAMMKLESVHPDVTIDEVLANMQFKPIIPDEVPTTPPPTEEEVLLIRRIDPYCMRRFEFTPIEFKRRFRF